MWGCLKYVWTESLKCQYPLKQGRKEGFKNRQYSLCWPPNYSFENNGFY